MPDAADDEYGIASMDGERAAARATRLPRCDEPPPSRDDSGGWHLVHVHVHVHVRVRVHVRVDVRVRVGVRAAPGCGCECECFLVRSISLVSRPS